MRAALFALLLAVPAAAQEASPIPERRPAELLRSEATAPADAEEAVAAPPAPLPPPLREALRLTDDEEAACREALSAAGATFTEAEPVIEEGDRDCGILSGVRLEAVQPGIAFDPPDVLRCPAALAAALWARDLLLPAAERAERGALTALVHSGTYSCRRRNNEATGKLSQHGVGNAIDVVAFRFADGPPIDVAPRERDGTRAEAFQDAARATACLEFTTVLGPGADAYHDDHLHLDVIQRNRGFRLCQ